MTNIQIGDNVHVAFLNRTGYVVAVHEDICKSYSVKFSDGQQWNIVENSAELILDENEMPQGKKGVLYE